MLSLPLLTIAAEGPDPLGHVVNHPALKNAEGYWLWSGNQGNLVLTTLIMIVGGFWAASKIRTGPSTQGAEAFVTRSKFAHLFEVICVYLRDEVARPLLHDRTDKLMPFLWTIFYFILVNNLLGLIPLTDLQHVFSKDLAEHHEAWIGGTATQNIWVTGTLAIIAALVFNFAAIGRLGIVGYFKHMTGGLPIYMFPIAALLFIIEFAGQVAIKPVALAIRLFANMTAGHVLLATLLIFAGSAAHRGEWATDGPVMVLNVVASMAVTLLELFVAFLQAFVFMFLTTVFISLMDHHDEHGHEHEHGHAHGHEHAHA